MHGSERTAQISRRKLRSPAEPEFRPHAQKDEPAPIQTAPLRAPVFARHRKPLCPPPPRPRVSRQVAPSSPAQRPIVEAQLPSVQPGPRAPGSSPLRSGYRFPIRAPGDSAACPKFIALPRLALLQSPPSYHQMLPAGFPPASHCRPATSEDKVRFIGDCAPREIEVLI